MKAALTRDLPESQEEILREAEKKLTLWETELSTEPLIISRLYREKYGETGFADEIDRILPLWLSYSGPLTVDSICAVYPAGGQEILDCLETFRESEDLIIDLLTEDAAGDQACTAENLELLFRLKRRKGRSAFKALPIEKLQPFLARHQGLTSAGSGREELQEAFEKLIAYGAAPALWESDILPARLDPYYKSWLDGLFQESPLLWYGCGKEKLAFCFEEEQSLFIHPDFGHVDSGEQTEENLAGLFPDRRGSFSFWDLKEHSARSSSELAALLWKESWRGRLSNDHYAAVRSGILNKFKADTFHEMERKSGGRRISRGGYSRWKNSRPAEGRWFLTEPVPEDEDLIEKDERQRNIIRQLFLRYGVLFRQLLEREPEGQNWNDLFRTLRLMELSGECVSGYFFEDIRGIQFAGWEALRELSEPMDDEAFYWMNCSDPASLAGVKLDALKGRYPSRLSGNHMVFRGERPILFSRRNGKELEFPPGTEEADVLEALAFFRRLLGREFNPLKSIRVEKINGEPVSESPFRELLKRAGFRDNYNVFILS
jgi:ATP-dependent Lhr-like helicase